VVSESASQQHFMNLSQITKEQAMLEKEATENSRKRNEDNRSREYVVVLASTSTKKY
jgi:hypothetical protein